MIIRILDSDLRIVSVLRKYTYCQYTNKFRGVGTFQINARMIEENLFMLEKNKDFFVLFDEKVFGKIEKIEKKSDSEHERTLQLTGRLSNYILTKRINRGTISFEGLSHEFIFHMINLNVISSQDKKRNININISYDRKELLDTINSKVKKQVTGGYVWTECEKVLQQDKLGIYFIPKLKPVHIPEGQTKETNISEWDLIISGGVNRTKSNYLGYSPIVFSQSLSNIKRTEYETTSDKYTNIAYIAGEGEGTSRKWYEININEQDTSEEIVGWNRDELWIDARDIQSEDADGNIIDTSQYTALIHQRANEKATENNRVISYSATLTNVNKQHTYGKDYFLGDFVTIIDDEISATVDAQVIEVTRTIQDAEEIYDIELEYGTINKDPISQLTDVKLKNEQNENAIKYLETTVTVLKNTLVNKFVKQFYLAMNPVGSIVENTSGINPSVPFGGEWELYGAGRTAVCIDTNDTNFNSVGKTGGANSVNLVHSHTVDSHTHNMLHSHAVDSHTHGMSHNHTVDSHAHTQPLHKHLQTFGADDNATYEMGGGGQYGSAVVNTWRKITNSSYEIGSARLHYTSESGNENTGSSAPSTSYSGANTGATAPSTNNSGANTGGATPNTSSASGDTSIIQKYIVVYRWRRTK